MSEKSSTEKPSLAREVFAWVVVVIVGAVVVLPVLYLVLGFFALTEGLGLLAVLVLLVGLYNSDVFMRRG